jgi:hypothetical protein
MEESHDHVQAEIVAMPQKNAVGRRAGALAMSAGSKYHPNAVLAGATRTDDPGAGAVGDTPLPASPAPRAAAPAATTGAEIPNAVFQHGKAPSVHSRGSGASASSAADLPLRGITAKGARLERSLVILDRAIIIAFLVVAAMSIASLIVISTQVSQLGDSLELVGATARRALDAQRITFGLMDLNLAKRGMLPQVADNGTALRRYMLDDAAAFEGEHTSLFAQVSAAHPEELALYLAQHHHRDPDPGAVSRHGSLQRDVRKLEPHECRR